MKKSQLAKTLQPSFHFLFLIVNTSTSQKIEQKKNESNDHNDADRKITVKQVNITTIIVVIIFCKIDESWWIFFIPKTVIGNWTVFFSLITVWYPEKGQK